jgi:hypothetical protein
MCAYGIRHETYETSVAGGRYHTAPSPCSYVHLPLALKPYHLLCSHNAGQSTILSRGGKGKNQGQQHQNGNEAKAKVEVAERPQAPPQHPQDAVQGAHQPVTGDANVLYAAGVKAA